MKRSLPTFAATLGAVALLFTAGCGNLPTGIEGLPAATPASMSTGTQSSPPPPPPDPVAPPSRGGVLVSGG